MNDPPGIYIHIPFCRTKCPYCDFYSVTGGAEMSRYFDALEAEARERAGEPGGPAGTLYVGGGTPSCAGSETVSSLPAMVSRHIGLAAGAEITIEVNPDDVTPGALERYLSGRFNRISVGVQSFDDPELEYLGRRHDAAAAERAVRAARSAGFPNIGIDLIFGIAGQTVESWKRSLDRAVALEPEHLSCYQLTIEPHTPFGVRASAGEELAVEEELAREMFLVSSTTLTAAGFTHYEVSNFARGVENRSRHNTGYWRRRPYLGLGPSAHSFDGGRRRWNHGALDAWLAAVEAGGDPAAGFEDLSKDQVRAELLMLGFRTSDGVEKRLLESHPGWEDTLEELIDLSLVRVDGDRVMPTPEGFLVADQLPVLFMQDG